MPSLSAPCHPSDDGAAHVVRAVYSSDWSVPNMLSLLRSLLVQLQGMVGELTWPYDEEETILCLRYSVSALLATAAFAILLNTFLA